MTERHYRDRMGVVHVAADEWLTRSYTSKFTLCERLDESKGLYNSAELAIADDAITTCVSCLGAPVSLWREWHRQHG